MKSLKKILAIGFAAVLTMTALSAQAPNAPFTKGVNLTKWFEIWQPGIPNLKVYDKTDFIHLKELGCDVVRVPIHFNMFMDKETGKVEPIIFEYLDQVCDWAEELQMYLIIDNHSYNSGVYPAPGKLSDHLDTVWPQIAKRYKKRSPYIIYEILNEPQIRNDQWEPIQKEALEVIRKIDKKRTVVVTGADWSSLDAMTRLTPLADKNLIYTFHFYEPYMFTHQGADWAERAIACLENIPFPYDETKMPELKRGAKGTHVENDLKFKYPKSGNGATLKNSLKRAVTFAEKNNVPVWCGEMGVYDLVAPDDSRTNWYNAVGNALRDYNIPFTVWGYEDRFGIFKKDTLNQYPYDLNVPVLQAVGMNVPELAGTPGPGLPPTEFPVILYDDFGGKGTAFNTWSMISCNTSYKINPAQGTYSIRMNSVDRYGAFSVEFGNIDLSSVKGKEKNTILSFKVKFTSADQQFQVRFVDTDDGTEENPPYRLMRDIKASDYSLNTWISIDLPVSEMIDVGAWSNITNTWYDGKNAFSWSRVKNLEFAAEAGQIKGELFLDDIKIIQK